MDIVERAQAALDAILPDSLWAVNGAQELADVVPELIAEIQRLRSNKTT